MLQNKKKFVTFLIFHRKENSFQLFTFMTTFLCGFHFSFKNCWAAKAKNERSCQSQMWLHTKVLHKHDPKKSLTYDKLIFAALKPLTLTFTNKINNFHLKFVRVIWWILYVQLCDENRAFLPTNFYIKRTKVVLWEEE